MTAHVRPLPAAASRSAGLHVLVIGGGIGGLTLAHGLKKAGVSVAVYERDRTVTSRLQGYRVHISPTGSAALHECLPGDLFALFDRTCGRPNRAVRFLTEQMKVLLAFEGDVIADVHPIARHRSASRITLRQVLLSGLEDVVHFGKTFTRYEQHGARVAAHFEDGTTAEGDILVAADGGGSRVRRQFLPQAGRIDTGVVGIAAKVFLDEARERIAEPLRDAISLVAAKGGFGLFVAAHEASDNAPGMATGEAAAVEAGNLFDNRRGYLMWALSGRRAAFGFGQDVEALDGATLATAAVRTMRDWSAGFRDLVALSDPTTFSCLRIRTSVPVAPWPTGRITFLGDAIHSMTPYRGIGANVALRDAARLARALAAAPHGDAGLIQAIHAYECEMIDYGFRAVRNSLRAMEQTVSTSGLQRALTRAAFRAIDKMPPLKRRMARGLGEA